MLRKDHKDNEGQLDENLERLLSAAYESDAGSASFKEKLRRQLEQELSKVKEGKESRMTGNSDILEQNLGRLLSTAAVPVELDPDFKERLGYRLQAEWEAKQRKQSLPRWVPAFVTAIAAVLVLGMVIYPNYWADRGTSVAAAIVQGTGLVTQTKPLFFNMGNRIVASRLASGDDVSLATGDRIATGPDSVAVVTLPNYSTVRLYPNSDLVVNALETDGDGGSQTVVTSLAAGKANSKINSLQFEMATPSSVANVLGTAFRVEVVAGDHTYLATDEGAVRLTMNGNSVEVSAGEEVDAIKGQPLVVRPQGLPSLIIDSPTYPQVSSSPVTLSGRTDVDAIVTVNGDPVIVDLNGGFSTNIELEPGANHVAVVSTNPTGKTTAVNIILVLE